MKKIEDVKKILEAYLICNEEVLEKEDIEKVKKSIEFVKNLEKGFEFKGQIITKPGFSPDGRWQVDPVKFYGKPYLNWIRKLWES